MLRVRKKDALGHLFLALLVTLVFTGYLLVSYAGKFQEFVQAEQRLCARLGAEVDNLFASVESVSEYCSLRPSMSEIIVNGEKATILDYKEVQDDIGKLVSSNPLYHSIYIYFINSGTVLTDYSFYTLDEFFDRALIGRILNRSGRFIWYDARPLEGSSVVGSSGGVVSLVRHFPIVSRAPSAAIVINMEQSTLLDVIRDGLEGGRFQITQDGRVIADSESATPLGMIEPFDEPKDWKEEEGSYRFHAASSIEGFQYFYTVPTAKFSAPFNQRLRPLAALYGAVLLISAALLQVVLRTRGRGYALLLRKIGAYLTTLSQSGEELDDFATLSVAIDRMVLQNRRIESTIEQYSPMIRNQLITDLLLGLTNAAHLDGLPYGVELSFAHPAFLCVVCDVYNSDDPEDAQSRERIRMYIKGVTEDRFAKFADVCGAPLLSDRLAFILNYPPALDITRLLRQAIEELTERFRREVNSAAFFALGSVEQSTEGINRSYMEAGRNLGGKFLDDSRFVAPHEPDDSVYPLSLQHAVVTCFVGSDLEGMKERLRLFFTQGRSGFYSFQEVRLLSALFVSGVLTELFAHGYNLATDTALRIVSGIMAAKRPQELSSVVIGALEELYNDQNNAAALEEPLETQYITQVVRYINEHYQQNISIADIASCVHLNPRYLGKLFKDATDYTLTEYLNRTRIRRSKDLLLGSEQTIQKIGSLAGYADVRAYIRFFKKYEGCTPGEFRGRNC